MVSALFLGFCIFSSDSYCRNAQMHITPRNGLFTWRNSIIVSVCRVLFDDGTSFCLWQCDILVMNTVMNTVMIPIMIPDMLPVMILSCHESCHELFMNHVIWKSCQISSLLLIILILFNQERTAHHRARDVTMHSMVFIRVFSEGRWYYGAELMSPPSGLCEAGLSGGDQWPILGASPAPHPLGSSRLTPLTQSALTIPHQSTADIRPWGPSATQERGMRRAQWYSTSKMSATQHLQKKVRRSYIRDLWVMTHLDFILYL